MSETNPKLVTILNLLAKAEGTDNQAEADIYRSKAFELMAKFGVDEALLNSHRPEGTRETPVVRVVEVLVGPYQKQRKDFLQKLMTALGCENVYYLNYKQKRQRRSKFEMRYNMPKKPAVKNEPETMKVECVGFPSDLDRAEILWTSLVLQMHTMLLDDSKMGWMGRGEKRSYNNGRVAGFISEVSSRVRLREAATRQEAKQDETTGSSTALVLASREDAVAALWRERHDPKSFSRSSSSFGQSNDYGKEAGRASGRRANIGGTGLGRAEQKGLTA